MRKPAIFISFIILIIIALSLVQTIVSNSLTTTGSALSKLEENINFYETQNSLLKEKLLSTSSLSSVLLTAQERGFVKDVSHLSITTSLPIVRLQNSQKEF